MIEHFTSFEADLNLDSKPLSKTRTKRGAFDFIGNVALSLFGIADSEYANKMSTTIKNLQENDFFMLILLRDQTSVANSTMNLLRQGLTFTKFNVDHVQSQISAINVDSKILHNYSTKSK